MWLSILLLLTQFHNAFADEVVSVTSIRTIYTTFCPTEQPSETFCPVASYIVSAVDSFEFSSDHVASNSDSWSIDGSESTSYNYATKPSSIVSRFGSAHTDCILNDGSLMNNVSFVNFNIDLYYKFDVNCSLYEQYELYGIKSNSCDTFQNVVCPMTSGGTSWNITTGVNKRAGDDFDVIDSYDNDHSKNLKKEFESTIDDNLKKYLSDSKFVGAISTFMDIYHQAVAKDSSDVNNDLLRFYGIFTNLWDTFWKVNNHKTKGGDAKKLCGRELEKNEDVTVFTRAIGYMYIVALPISHYVFSEVYKEAVDYLNSQSDIFKDTCITEMDKEWVTSLLQEGDDMKRVVSYFLDLYESYGNKYGEAPDKKNRIVDGWGASKSETDIDAIDQDTGDILNSGFILGIPSLASASLANIFALFSYEDVASAPLSKLSSSIADKKTKDIEDHTYSTPEPTTESASSELYSSESETETESECPSDFLTDGEAYPNMDNEGEWVEDADENDDYSLKRDGNSDDFKKRTFGEMCGTADTNGNFEECTEVLGRHMVAVKRDDNLIGTRKEFSNIDDNNDENFNMRDNTNALDIEVPGSKRDNDGNPILQSRPIYIVNQNGRSPGIACNALKFLSNHFDDNKYFQGKVTEDEFGYSGKPMLALQRGTGFTRSDVIQQYSCLKTDDDDLANQYNTLNMKWQRDEFPPASANQLAASSDEMSVSCVPFYDNQIDGCQISRFYSGTESKKIDASCILRSVFEVVANFYIKNKRKDQINADDIKNGKSNKYRCFPGIILVGQCRRTDYLKRIPNGDKGRDSNKVESGKFFGVLVNIYDFNNKPIDCTQYDEGSSYKYSVLS